MGGSSSKESFKAAIDDLINNQQAVAGLDDTFWERFWSDASITANDVFTLITRPHVLDLMSKGSGNFTALCFKLVTRLSTAVCTACSGPNEHAIVLNCVRLLTRLLPFLFESDDWRLLFWTPAHVAETPDSSPPPSLAQVLLNSLTDLLFCPDFTVVSKSSVGPERPDDLSTLDSSEYIWETGIGCSASPGTTKQIDTNRAEILKLLTTCFSETLYITSSELDQHENKWLAHFTSSSNRHILPLLTSLLNTICKYDPVGYGVPYYYALVRDVREELVEASLNLIIILLNYTPPTSPPSVTPPHIAPDAAAEVIQRETGLSNLFTAYISRLHQSDDLEFLVNSLTSLISNPYNQRANYLPVSTKRIFFSEALYILLWKFINYNQKFLAHLLRGAKLFDILVPLLYELVTTRNNPNMVGLLHVGVFILLVLSGERNFGVRLNKPFMGRVFSDIPRFTGSHADLLFLVFHRIITSGLSRIQPLYDCLLTVLVNVSPYLKSMCMVTCTRLMHLMESFATPWYLFARPSNHYLVFYLLEIFNNIVQYQFDGNINLIYSIVRSKDLFYQLAGLSEDSCLTMFPKSKVHTSLAQEEEETEESEATHDREDTCSNMPDIETLQKVDLEVTELENPNTSSQPNTPLGTPTEAAPPSIKEVVLSGDEPKSKVSSDTLPTFSSSYDPPAKSLPSKLATPTMPLMPLRKQTAAKNKQLLEPLSPANFKPTPEWVKSWKQKLPLHTILRLLQILVPQVEKLCQDLDIKSEKEILEYLKNGTLVGLLPVPHPIIIRKFQSSQSTEVWFQTYIWGVVFSRAFDPPIWFNTEVKLFIVNKPEF